MHKRQDTATSAYKEESSSRKGQIWISGEAHISNEELWIDLYTKKSIWRRVFDVSTTDHNAHVRALQDRVVFTAMLWASCLAVVLTVGSVCIPSASLF
ncbi:hypothetical protein F5B20DRAFT_525179 [Whalleya microplaca]|nr:hypothetical protein F5B20DRAFT_525179 [Whalleya microplaca]